MNTFDILKVSNGVDIFPGCKFPTPFAPNVMKKYTRDAQPEHIVAVESAKRIIDDINLYTKETRIMYYDMRGTNTYVQSFKIVSELPLFIYENRCALKYIFNSRVIQDVNIECLGNVQPDDQFNIKDKMYLLNVKKELEFILLREDWANTLEITPKMKVYDFTITYKLPFYMIGNDAKTGEPYDFDRWILALRHTYDGFECDNEDVCSYVNVLCQDNVNYHLKIAFYNDYLTLSRNINNVNPAHFIIYDDEIIRNNIKRDFYTWNTVEDGVEKFGGDIRNEDEYYDIMDTVLMSYPYAVYLDLLSIFDCCTTKDNMKTFKDKITHKAHKAHKAHIYEYFIDDVRFEFEGKLDDLIDKLKAEIKDCPKATNSIKKRYNINKIS